MGAAHVISYGVILKANVSSREALLKEMHDLFLAALTTGGP